jgi:hypothetical protein
MATMSKAKNVSAGVSPQNKKKMGPVDPKGAYTKVQERTIGKMKMGGTMKKDEDNSSFAKLAPPYNKATFADKIAGANKGKAKNGTAMHKMPNGSMMKNSMMEMGGSLKKPSADQKGLKKLPKPVRNKMGYQKNGGKMIK